MVHKKDIFWTGILDERQGKCYILAVIMLIHR